MYVSALDALGVRVLGRREAALGEPQLADEVVERLLGDSPVALLSGDDQPWRYAPASSALS